MKSQQRELSRGSGGEGGKNALFVLGMHRSGTSAITGVFACLGVQLGHKLYAPHAGVNDKGYWEHSDIVDTHDDIFRVLGSHWDDVLPLPEKWWELPAIDSQINRLRLCVKRDFSQAKLWGLKDPRVCRLLPLWIELTGAMQINVRYVIVVRPPQEVVRSLSKRNHFSTEKSMLLWLVHNLEAERLSRGKKRVVVLFDDLLQNTAPTLSGIQTRLQLDFPIPIEQAMPEIEAFLSPDLRHHTSSAEFSNHPFAELAEHTYQIFQKVANSNRESDDAAFDLAYQRLQERIALFDPVLVEHLRLVSKRRGYYEKLFLDAYQSWSWKLTWPLRALEKWIVRT